MQEDEGLKAFENAELGLVDGEDHGLVLVRGEAGENVDDGAGGLGVQAWGGRERGGEGGGEGGEAIKIPFY